MWWVYVYVYVYVCVCEYVWTRTQTECPQKDFFENAGENNFKNKDKKWSKIEDIEAMKDILFKSGEKQKNSNNVLAADFKLVLGILTKLSF